MPTMTKLEYDTFLKRIMSDDIPTIAKSLRRANGIAIAKELYAIGAIDDWTYTDVLLYLAKLEGFDFKDDVKKKETAR